MVWRLLLCFATCAALALWAVPAPAQTAADKTTARQLFFDARDAFETGKYAEAAALFERSNKLFPAPTAALGLARSLEKSGKLVRAFETYSAMLSQDLAAAAPKPFHDAMKDARVERSALEPRLAALVIAIEGPEQPVVTLDGAALDSAALGVRRFVDPGEHLVEVEADGFASNRETVRVGEGEVRELRIRLRALASPAGPSPASPEPSVTEAGWSTMHVAGVVVGSLGLASLVVSAVTGGLYLSKKSVVDEQCTQDDAGTFHCVDEAGPSAAKAGHQLAVANTVTLVVGLAALATGVTLFVLGSGEDETTVRAGLGRVTLEGRF